MAGDQTTPPTPPSITFESKIHPATTVSNIQNFIPIKLEIESSQYNSWSTLFQIHSGSRMGIIPMHTGLLHFTIIGQAQIHITAHLHFIPIRPNGQVLHALIQTLLCLDPILSSPTMHQEFSGPSPIKPTTRHMHQRTSSRLYTPCLFINPTQRNILTRVPPLP
ncbi:hypothetical protein Hdeb2414_s0012g00380311 [Helianthus debilis subsp. tardiflorus]